MAGLNVTTGSYMLKNLYLPVIREQLNNKTILWKYPGKDKESISGGNIVINVHLGRNAAYGALADTGTPPSALYQVHRVTGFAPKYHFIPINITDPMMKRMKDDKGSWARALASESKGAANDLGKYLNYLAFGNGTGKLAKCALTTASAWLNVVTARRLDVGAIVDIITSAGAENATDLTISSKTSATQVVVSSTVTTAITDIVVMANSYNVCMMGLEGIVDTTDPPSGDFEGIDRATWSEWQGNVSENSGTARTLTLAMLETAVNTVDRWGSKTNIILSNYGVRNKYSALCTTNKRFVNKMELDGGFSALEFDGIPWTVDTDCDYVSPTNGKAYFLDLEHLTHYQLMDFDWLADDKGAILQRSGISWGAILGYYGEFGTDKPRAHYLLDDIITDAEIE